MQHEAIPYKEVLKTDLPYRLASIYHDCGDYKVPKIRKQGPPLCINCNKYVPWFFHKCVVCDEYFVRDFRDNRFCNFYPTCWEHTQELPWEYCADHSYNYNRDDRELYVQYPPVGLNPKNFSDEELEGVFDFD